MDYEKLAERLFPNVRETPEDMEKRYPPRNLPEGAVVTRMAPSPTGFVHLGNLVQGKSQCKRIPGILLLADKETIVPAVEVPLTTSVTIVLFLVKFRKAHVQNLHFLGLKVSVEQLFPYGIIQRLFNGFSDRHLCF